MTTPGKALSNMRRQDYPHICQGCGILFDGLKTKLWHDTPCKRRSHYMARKAKTPWLDAIKKATSTPAQ